MRSFTRRGLTLLIAALTVSGLAAPATASPATDDPPTVTYDDVLPHLERFQQIADDNGGNRAHGTPGFDASVDYVRTKLTEAGFTTHVETFTHDGKQGRNLIADWPGGDTDDVLLLGAHLDSVAAGPGMNDNASGSAALLTTALTVAKRNLQSGKHLRFAWWGAEEEGLVGSERYAAGRSKAELDKIDTYVNFDMAGTRDAPNYVVIDTGAEASGIIEKFLRAHGRDILEVEGGEGGDNASFAKRKVPTAGFMTGLDDCYHSACDRLSNIDPETETLSTNAMLDAVWRLAEQPGGSAGVDGTSEASEASEAAEDSEDLAGLGDPYYPEDGNAGYDVGHYDVKLDYDPAKPDHLGGDTTITATATQELTRFNLDLVGYTVTGATVNGEAAQHRRESEHELVLTPSRKIHNGQKFTVRVRYDGEPAGEGWHRISGGGFTAYGEPHSATSWYPANDHPSDKATFSLAATVPDGWQVMGNGLPGRTTKAGGRSTFRWHEDSPMATYLSTVAVDRFDVHKDTVSDGIPAIYGYGTGAKRAPESEKLMKPMLDYFGSLFGPYPFDSTGGIVVAPEDGNPALETQSRPTYATGGMFDASMAHELSHMWFGNAVTIEDWRNACLNECIAQYANQLWEEHEGADIDKDFYASEVEANKDDPEFWATRLYDPGKGKELDSALYTKGSLMSHALRKAMGDEKFFALLKRWVDDNRGGNAGWPQFEALASELAGKDLGGFFDAWVHSTTIPPEKYLFPAGRP